MGYVDRDVLGIVHYNSEVCSIMMFWNTLSYVHKDVSVKNSEHTYLWEEVEYLEHSYIIMLVH